MSTLMPFDREYYKRFYLSSEPVYGPKEIDQLCRGITGFLEFVEAPPQTVLEAGAGLGMVRDWFSAHRPEVKVRSVDISEYACQTYGHEQRDLARWCEPETRFDLIFVHGVLCYLSDEDCAAAIENLARMSSGFLYLNEFTEEDLGVGNVDIDVSDFKGMNFRPIASYLGWLKPHFVRAGLGLFYHRGQPPRLRSMERCG